MFDVISGMKNACEVVIEIAMTTAALGYNIPFYLTQDGKNNVLSPGLDGNGIIPSEIFRSIWDVKSGDFCYQKPIDYICVYDIQESVKLDVTKINKDELIELSVVVIDLK